eukprot:4835374-Amphidinium_carterae.1
MLENTNKNNKTNNNAKKNNENTILIFSGNCNCNHFRRNCIILTRWVHLLIGFAALVSVATVAPGLSCQDWRLQEVSRMTPLAEVGECLRGLPPEVSPTQIRAPEPPETVYP